MATVKITVTLPKEQVEQISALIAADQATNISAFIKHAVAVALADAAGWKEMLDDALQQTGGPLTKEERIWADENLGPKRSPRTRRKRAA